MSDLATLFLSDYSDICENKDFKFSNILSKSNYIGHHLSILPKGGQMLANQFFEQTKGIFDIEIKFPDGSHVLIEDHPHTEDSIK